jgi:quinol monooxygenase YgiN
MTGKHYVFVRFELQPGEMEKLVPLIKDFFENEVSTFPGFVSAKFHRNEAGSVLINYATWESAEQFQAFMGKAMHSERSKKIQAFNSSADRVFEIAL